MMDYELKELGQMLDGRSKTAMPVVTKNDMLKSIRQHNDCLTQIGEGCTSLATNLDALSTQQTRVVENLYELETRFKQHEIFFGSLDQRLQSTTSQVAQLWKQMDKVASLEQQCREQEARARDIQSWREQLTTARKQEASQHEKLMAAFKSEMDEHDRSILTIQDRLCRLSKELYIGSDQVSIPPQMILGILPPTNADEVEPKAEGKMEMSLTSALSLICATSQEIRRGLDLQRRTAVVHAKELENRASKETELLAAQNREKLEKIQNFLDSNMDVDLMDIRRNQDLILSQLEDYQNDLDNKLNGEEVNALIQSHHAELISHIQTALRSVKDDEISFKACIDRIESTTNDLKTVKAERTELKELRMQLEVQISEAIKAASELSPEALEKLSNTVKREDLLLMLQDKADNSVVDLASNSIAALTSSIANMVEKYQKVFVQMSQERELGDKELSSRLDKLENRIAPQNDFSSKIIKWPLQTSNGQIPTETINNESVEVGMANESEMIVKLAFASKEKGGSSQELEHQQSASEIIPSTIIKTADSPQPELFQSDNYETIPSLAVDAQPCLTSFLQN